MDYSPYQWMYESMDDAHVVDFHNLERRRMNRLYMIQLQTTQDMQLQMALARSINLRPPNGWQSFLSGVAAGAIGPW